MMFRLHSTIVDNDAGKPREAFWIAKIGSSIVQEKLTYKDIGQSPIASPNSAG